MKVMNPGMWLVFLFPAIIASLGELADYFAISFWFLAFWLYVASVLLPGMILVPLLLRDFFSKPASSAALRQPVGGD